jgi:hypothetical protein
MLLGVRFASSPASIYAITSWLRWPRLWSSGRPPGFFGWIQSQFPDESGASSATTRFTQMDIRPSLFVACGPE